MFQHMQIVPIGESRDSLFTVVGEVVEELVEQIGVQCLLALVVFLFCITLFVPK